jgi:hypothetical protein
LVGGAEETAEEASMGIKNKEQSILALVEEDKDEPGVELEREELGLVIERPFDPEKIKVKTKTALVETIVSRIAHQEIDLAPDFQRRAGVWDLARKGRLIESLLLRIPLPVFYVAADVDENWSVVDGLQRLTTINDFIKNRIQLSNLEYLTQLNGKIFDELPRPMQRRIRETELVVHVIEPGTPEEVMFNIFRRINTGGMSLNGQEIRHALHKGTRDYLKKLAESKEFIDATDHSVRPDRMADRECVLRFLAFTITPWQDYKGNDLDGFLSEAMTKIKQLPRDKLDCLEHIFVRAMRLARDLFGKNAFRKPSLHGGGRNPFNKALFEAWSVALAECNDHDSEILRKYKEFLQDIFIERIELNSSFYEAISYGTGDRKKVAERFSVIQSVIKGCLEAIRRCSGENEVGD